MHWGFIRCLTYCLGRARAREQENAGYERNLALAMLYSKKSATRFVTRTALENPSW